MNTVQKTCINKGVLSIGITHTCFNKLLRARQNQGFSTIDMNILNKYIMRGINHSNEWFTRVHEYKRRHEVYERHCQR